MRIIAWSSDVCSSDLEHAITANEALDLADRPKRIVIVGSGYIAVEFAGIFHGFGSDTHLVYRADKVLRGFDEDMSTALTGELEKKGLALRPQTLPTRIEKAGDCALVSLSDGEKLEVDAVIYATGRAPNPTRLRPPAAGAHPPAPADS